MTLHFLLMADQVMLQKLLMEKLADTELTPGQPRILDYLIDHDGSSQTEIAQGCYIEGATLTSVLNGMEAKGLVERRRQDGNRRTYYIHLTEKGKAMCRRVEEAFCALEDEAFAGIEPEQRDQFFRSFHVVHEKLDTMFKK